jgi:hypothetical protein
VRAGAATGEGLARFLAYVAVVAIVAGDVELREICDRASCVVTLVEPPANGVTAAPNRLLLLLLLLLLSVDLFCGE